MTVNQSNKYTCLYTVSLSPNTDKEAFERAMVDEIMPKLFVSRRNIRRLDLEHRLLKDIGKQGDGEHVWQVRALEFDMVSNSPDYDFLFAAIAEDVRRALAPWGTVASTAVFQEMGTASPEA
jgi:hypothetical protein